MMDALQIDSALTGEVGDGGEDQVLTFTLADEEYGVDILRVQEIKGWDSVTGIPNTPDYIRGVINLRGTIVPVIDMRLRFGLPPLEYGPLTVVIVLRVESGSRTRIMGIVVDAVSDVYNLPEDRIRPAPDFGGTVESEFITGLAGVEDKMVIVLDVDRLLNSRELAVMDALGE